MTNLLTDFLWWLGQDAITVAVLVPLVVTACRLCRERPAVQRALWIVVLIKFVTPSVVAWPWTARDVRRAMGSVKVPTRLVASRLGTSPNPAERFLDGLPPGASEARGGAREEADRSIADSGASWLAFREARSTRTRLLLAGMFVFWLGGASFCLVRQCRRAGRILAVLRRSTAAPGELLDEVAGTAVQLMMRPPPVAVVGGILSPFVWCLRPLRLVWPQAMLGRNELARARGVIAHELAHIRGGDHWLAWLVAAAGIIWWWNPLFWFARRRLREATEMTCDAIAIEAAPDRCRYAQLLLELSAGGNAGAAGPALGVSAGSRSSFERRLSMILCERVSAKTPVWGTIAAACLALAAVPGWSRGQPEPPKPAPQEEVSTPQHPGTWFHHAHLQAASCESCHVTVGSGPAAHGDLALLRRTVDELRAENQRLHDLLRENADKSGSATAKAAAEAQGHEARKSGGGHGTTVELSSGINFAATPVISDDPTVANSAKAVLAQQQALGKPLAVRVLSPLSSTGAGVQVLNRFRVQYVFADLEGADHVAETATLVSQVRASFSRNAFIGNFNLDAARAQRDQAEETYRRQAKLLDAKRIPQEQLEVAKAELDKAVATVAAAEVDVRVAAAQAEAASAAQRPPVHVFALRYTSVAKAGQMLAALFPKKDDAGPRIAMDERTNSILVVGGSGKDIELVQEIVTRVDVPTREKPAEPKERPVGGTGNESRGGTKTGSRSDGQP